MFQKYLIAVAPILFCLFVLGASTLAQSGHARADEGDIELPQIPRPAGEVNFDEEFLETLMLTPHVRNFVSHVPGPLLPSKKERSERDFAILIEIFRFAQVFANQFQGTQDKTYATVGDFRAVYLHSLPKQVPANVQLQVEAFQATTALDPGLSMKTVGGGAGIRADFHPAEKGTISITFDPVYGEKRDFNAVGGNLKGGTDWIARTSVGVAYLQKIGEVVEPGVQVMFQPQLLDFTQFRVYTEAFVRLKIVHDKISKENRYAIRDVSIVPKVVYWRSTDKGGLFGDPVASNLGNNYFKFASNLYGFINLEFHFAR